jgi:rhamnogalacturonyl hydrolase YesR
MRTIVHKVFLITLLLFACSQISSQSSLYDFNKEDIKSTLFKIADWQNQHKEHITKYRPLNWHLASFYIGLMEMYKTTGEHKYFDQLYLLGKKYDWTTEDDIFDADRLAIGQVYLEIFKEKKDPSIINRLQWVLDAHIARKTNSDVRFKDNPYRREWWSWCDALFMAPPTFIKMYDVTGDEKYLDYAIKYWINTTDYLFDLEDNLIYRDDRFFEKRTASGKKVFWSRGNGWVFAGLVHMLNSIPKEHPKRILFIDQFKGMAKKLASIQSEDGMWRPSLLDAEAFPQPETSGSAFFCYGLLWGINHGLLPQEIYEPVVVKAWKALEKQVNEAGRVGFVQPPGIEPKPFTKENWEEYGTGAFLLAGSELHKILELETEARSFKKGKLLYESTLSTEIDLQNWVMEGLAKTEFKEGWMHMYSPDEEGHHVFWCPEDFPGDFIAEWELQNREPDAGLCIIFFAAKGVNGEDIFDPSLKKRDGVFRKYTKSDLNNYHISYYANADGNGRGISHLRKNKGFYLVQNGESGIPLHSRDIHKMKLVKDNNRILMYIDGRKIIDWTDDGEEYGQVLESGKIGFRQMQWSHFRYRNFKVWELEEPASKAWQRHTIDASSSGADGVKLADFNKDGKPDIVTGWEEGGITKLYLNPGGNKVKKEWPAVLVGETPKVEDAVFADMNNNGRMDVVSCTEKNSEKIFVHWSPKKDVLNPEKWKQEVLPASEGLMMWMYAEPLQLDGQYGVDLLAAGKGENAQLGWFEAPAKANDLSQWKWHSITPVGWIMSLILRDMDMDGDMDVVITDRRGVLQACRWLENPGDRTAQQLEWESHIIGAKGLEVMFMSMADIDGDGKEEAVVAERTDQTIRIFKKMDKKGINWQEQIIELPAMTGMAKSVEVGDVNGDGVQDLIISTNTDGLKKNGLTWFTGKAIRHSKEENFRMVSGAHKAKYDKVELVDLDGDGDLDILICEENFGENSRGLGVIWYENQLGPNHNK